MGQSLRRENVGTGRMFVHTVSGVFAICFALDRAGVFYVISVALPRKTDDPFDRSSTAARIVDVHTSIAARMRA